MARIFHFDSHDFAILSWVNVSPSSGVQFGLDVQTVAKMILNMSTATSAHAETTIVVLWSLRYLKHYRLLCFFCWTKMKVIGSFR
jgi:hypothetical protein